MAVTEHKCRDGSIEQRYSSKPTVAMMDVHGALSALLYACSQELRDVGGFGCELTYREGTYLTLVVECSTNKAAEAIAARLAHGVLWGDYDYRFRTISRSLDHDDGDEQYVTASVDLCHDRRELYADRKAA